MAQGFTMGFQAEVLLTLRDVQGQGQSSFSDLGEFANYLVSKYGELAGANDFPLRSDVDGLDEDHDESPCWTLVDDCTIDRTLPRQWPIEIVTPILSFRPGSNWNQQVDSFFANIERYCRIEANDSCGFHVHFAPVEGGWNTELLKPFCRATIHFEAAFEVIIPPQRRGNEYAKSNRVDNPKLRCKTKRQAFQALEQCNSNAHIADLMNNSGDRFFAWNFVNLYHGGIQTVEFRRGPGVNRSEQCQQWTELVIRFAQAAVRVDSAAISEYPADVHELRQFIRSYIPSETDLTILDRIFQGKSGALHPRPIRSLNAGERERLQQKDAQAKRKNLISRKMAALFCS